MGSFLLFAFSWWSILLRIVAIVHFIRRRPNFFWIWVILFHWVGALVYILVEVVPDASLLPGTFQFFPRRRRIQELERIILDNPSAGNYEELGQLYLDDGNFARARACYDKAISTRADHADPFYRRGIAEIELADFPAAVPDLERASNPILITTSTAPRACWPGPTRKLDSSKKRTPCFARPFESQRSPKRTITTRCFWSRKAVPQKLASGRARFSRKNPPCQSICGGASGPGFDGPARCWRE